MKKPLRRLNDIKEIKAAYKKENKKSLARLGFVAEMCPLGAVGMNEGLFSSSFPPPEVAKLLTGDAKYVDGFAYGYDGEVNFPKFPKHKNWWLGFVDGCDAHIALLGME